jgi:hypothetical protein
MSASIHSPPKNQKVSSMFIAQPFRDTHVTREGTQLLSASFNDLDVDLTSEIFKYLPTKELVSASNVCASWRNIAQEPSS